MAADNLSLLFRFRGDASGIRSATAEARQAVRQLAQTFGPELNQATTVANKAFTEIGTNLANLATQRVPVVGNAVSQLTGLLRGFGVEGKTTEKAINSVANSIANISQQSGKSTTQVAQFLTRYVQLGDQSRKNEAAFKEFGGSVDLIGNKTARFIPELEKASVELNNVAVASSSAGGRLAALAGPISAAVVAIAALVAGLILAGKAMFDMSRTTAEFQGRMQDLSQATGLAVETLSTLEVAITTTGGSLNTVTQAVVQFQRQLDEAQDPASKAAQNFERLGVAVTDTETALRDSLLALSKMPEGFQQTNAAAELFGSRGGKQVLALLKETNGDIDALQAKLREAGVLITGDAARAADKFNDELALLAFQTRALTAALVEDLIPVFTDLIKSSAEAVRALTPLIKLLVDFSLLGIPFRVGVQIISDSLKGLGFVARAVTLDFQGLKKAIKEAREEKFPTIAPIEVPTTQPEPIPQRSPRQEATERAQLAADALTVIRRAAAETNQALNEAFEQGRINRQRQADETIESNRRTLEADKNRIDAEVEGENRKFKEIQQRRDLAESERIDLLQQSEAKVRKLQQDRLNAESLFETTSREIRARAAKESADSRRNEEQNNTNLFISETDRAIKQIEARIAAGTQAESEGLAVIELLEQEKIAVQRESLEQQKRIGFLTVENRKDIDTQIQQLNQDADRLKDEQQARREQRDREAAERSRQLKLTEIQTLISLEQIKGASIIAAIEAQAALRIRTEESASREILRVRLQLIDDEVEALRAAEQATRSIVNVNERTQAQAELNARIRLLLAQRAALEAQGSREIDDARQRDIRNEQDAEDELADIRERAIDAQREASEEAIRLMIATFARRKDIIRAQRDLELAEEEDRHRRRTDAIRAEQQNTETEIRTLEKRLERLKIGTTEEIEEHDRLVAALERLRLKREELKRQQEAEDERSKTRKRRVTTEADDAEQEADPFGQLKVGLEDIKRFANELEITIVPLNQILKQSFLGVANAIGQVVANYVLLGTTGPAVIRKILAQALASIAAEAAVNAVKEAAVGFARLALGDFAGAASAFTSAGLWASIAGGTTLAGRGVAGNLFQQQSAASGGAGAGGAGSRTNESTRLIDLTRAQQREELHIFVHAEPGRGFSDEVVKAMISDVRRNGPARDVIISTAGG